MLCFNGLMVMLVQVTLCVRNTTGIVYPKLRLQYDDKTSSGVVVKGAASQASVTSSQLSVTDCMTHYAYCVADYWSNLLAQQCYCVVDAASIAAWMAHTGFRFSVL